MTTVRQWFLDIWRWLRQATSRHEWAVRLLRLPHADGPADAPGLVLVQVDGLSQTQLERAMLRHQMPFLRRLLRRKRYELRTFYSGLPSATPAMQGELFYGVHGSVPSFRFRDRQTGRSCRMFDPWPAAMVQARLSTQGRGLLEGGSAYCDIFSGGAAEPHFCPAEFGWGRLLRHVRPVRLAGFLLLYVDSAVRVAAMMAVEFVVALADCARGLIGRRNLWKELGMIPSRVAVGVLLRELLTIGATIDTARGLPVIHVNFLGYDEQAHRRGPASAFAHWSLKGIDRAIRRIWRASRHSRRRNYQVWIYSDHGQQRTVSYTEIMGRTVEQAVAEVFELPVEAPELPDWLPPGGIQYERSRWAGGPRLQKVLRPGRPPGHEAEPASGAADVRVDAMGSMGQIYCPPAASPEQRDRIARRLVAEAGIPMVLSAGAAGEALVWNSHGSFHLPRDARQVLGRHHPFLDMVTHDLIALCHHADAGQFVLCGWSRGGESISFSHEAGAHAGPSVEETRAFVLLPHNAAGLAKEGDYLRPVDLRRAAMELLGR
jgi:hypothetical protein